MEFGVDCEDTCVFLSPSELGLGGKGGRGVELEASFWRVKAASCEFESEGFSESNSHPVCLNGVKGPGGPEVPDTSGGVAG